MPDAPTTLVIHADGEFKAYLFDCDGTITDSMPAHHRAWLAALAEWGGDFPQDLFYAWGGRTVADVKRVVGTRPAPRLIVPSIVAHVPTGRSSPSRARTASSPGGHAKRRAAPTSSTPSRPR